MGLPVPVWRQRHGQPRCQGAIPLVSVVNGGAFRRARVNHVREFADKKLVKVWRNGQRRATCRFCQKSVLWVKTVNRERFMLFNGDAVALKTGRDDTTGDPVEYLDRADCHWEQCEPQPS